MKLVSLCYLCEWHWMLSKHKNELSPKLFTMAFCKYSCKEEYDNFVVKCGSYLSPIGLVTLAIKLVRQLEFGLKIC